jgi:hypothetical protein
MQRGDNALRGERCPRGSSIPSRTYNRTSNAGYLLEHSARLCQMALPPPSLQETLLWSAASGYRDQTFAGSLLSNRGLA